MKNLIKTLLTGMTAIFMCSNLSFAASDMVQIKGSDTLINLVQKLSEVYMEKNPGSYIAVTGGGSSTGIAGLINKKCNIANASRDMKGSEIDMAVAAGVTPKRVVVAIDGLSLIVNGNNPVKNITVETIGKVFRGEITNWKEIGGEDNPITLYGRQSSSGTYEFLRDVVLKGNYSPKTRAMNGNAEIVEAVRSDETGIGYVGVGYIRDVQGVTALEVAPREGAPYGNPLNMEDINTGKYPVSRPLNQYLSGTPSGAVRDFIAFELSPEGQKIVEEEGFIAIPKEYVEFNKKSVGI